VAHYGSQPHWGCPIGSLSNELAQQDPVLAEELAEHMDGWRAHLEAGLRKLPLRPGADPRRLALGVFAALQGGLLLTRTMQSIEPLEAALDGALAAIDEWRAPAASTSA
jgi:hypothetical protein